MFVPLVNKFVNLEVKLLSSVSIACEGNSRYIVGRN
jgi:hypothetical protein